MTTSSPPRPRLRTSSLAALASVPLLVLGLAACSPGSSGSDSASGSGAKSDSQVASDALAWDVANAQCMRGEGIDVPDPSSDGTSRGLKVGDGIDMDALGRASEKCAAEVTADLGPRPVSASEKKAQEDRREETRKTTACLREKGFDVSDPTDGSYIPEGLADVPGEALEACGMAGGSGSVTVER